ncbi:MAG: hypothetical protein GY757_16320 [bacterium]|nr:hypothetical protein [bacterium]
MDDQPYEIEYEFSFKDGKKKFFKILIEPKTMTSINKLPKKIPAWTKLEFEQCECCAYTKGDVDYCPIALNIAEMVDAFKDIPSTDNCTVRCTTPERTYLKDTSLQEGLFSVFGLVNATSKCPTMRLFKPLARFHLPFASIYESLTRTMSFYLLAQYFEYRRGKIPDLELKRLDEHFIKVQEVDEQIIARINSITSQDADRNAYVILNSMVQMLSMEIDDKLHTIEYLFDFMLPEEEEN